MPFAGVRPVHWFVWKSLSLNCHRKINSPHSCQASLFRAAHLSGVCARPTSINITLALTTCSHTTWCLKSPMSARAGAICFATSTSTRRCLPVRNTRLSMLSPDKSSPRTHLPTLCFERHIKASTSPASSSFNTRLNQATTRSTRV